MSQFVKRMRQVQLQLLQGSSVFGEEKSLRIQVLQEPLVLFDFMQNGCVPLSFRITHSLESS